MTLGGLAIAIGLLVDALVVVVENIEHGSARRNRPNRSRSTMHFRSVREVLPPVSGVVIIIIVFVPLLTLQGPQGRLFLPVALTITFALAASLVLSLTVIPLATSSLRKSGPAWGALVDTPRLRASTRMPTWARAMGARSGRGRRGLVAAVILYTQVGKTFMPTMDEGDILVGVDPLPPVGLDEAAQATERNPVGHHRRFPDIAG